MSFQTFNLLKTCFFLILVTIILLSCNSNNDSYEYYPNGMLKTKYSYIQNSLYDYTVTSYDTAGNINEVCNYKDNEIEGKLYSYQTSNGNKTNLKYINSYKKGVRHGISIYPDNKSSFPRGETLDINGKMILLRRLGHSIDSDIVTSVITNFKYINRDSLIMNGELCYSKEQIPIEDASEYYISNSKDTIEEGSSIMINIDFINKDDWYLELEIGELDSNLNFVSDVSAFKGENSISYEYYNHEKGWNLITGFLYAKKIIHKDSLPINKKYIYYHEYYAK